MWFRVPKNKWGFIANVLLTAVSTAAMIAFFVWRQDKPPDNPGGPLASMGGWVKLWNWLALGPGQGLAVWSGFNALLYVWERIKRRYGSPPPVKDGKTAKNVKTDVFVTIILFGAQCFIAFLIATRAVRFGADDPVVPALILLSLPLTVGMIPGARTETWRWAKWLS